MSHPTWVRGLKLSYNRAVGSNKKSHPTWVRGLKPDDTGENYIGWDVAPYVGAWIETPDCYSSEK